uniref:Uncharacterized protein n=1 Tax=Panagrellus redivivus TaxID=6233 RepID=A0A7E4VLM1_PANRE
MRLSGPSNFGTLYIFVLIALFVISAQAKLELTRIYSDPVQMLMQKPVSLEDLRYRRMKSLRDGKWKRRRATPIRISPFYYSMSPVDMVETSVSGAARARSAVNPAFSSYYG